MLEQYKYFEDLIQRNEERIQAAADDNPDIQRLLDVPGIGIMTATALAAAIPDKSEFKSGRHLAAWIGLVPKHSGTGGKTRILSISKRGNSYLRRLFIQGAGALLIWVKNRSDKVSKWAQELKDKRGSNKAKVALANKTARIAYAVFCKGADYKAAA
jgi:transposase